MLVRQGGDEFTILTPASVRPQELAGAIGAALAGPAIIAGHRLQPRASVGIATSNTEGTGWHTLACADAAMYTAKAAGGNHTLTYDPDRDGIPALDGTRPPIRRRELDPARRTGVAWLPTGAEDVVDVLVTPAELRLLHEALVQTRDRWQQHLTDLQTAAPPPADPAPTGSTSHPPRPGCGPSPTGSRPNNAATPT
jgi:Diguanylate cyclase, GGDEF domain